MSKKLIIFLFSALFGLSLLAQVQPTGQARTQAGPQSRKTSAPQSANTASNGQQAGQGVEPVGSMAVVGDSSLVVIELKNAVVVADVDPVKVVEDTVEYNPAAYRLAEDAMLEDLLRKIPGLEINGSTVTLHGREVKQILVDGQRFFYGNVRSGIKNISADMVEKVRAYDRESDFTRITGIDDGEQEPVLDLRIKKNMLDGWKGRLGGGYGLHNRYAASLNTNKISKNQQFTVMASANDINGTINIKNSSRTQLGGGNNGDSHKREAGFNFSKKTAKLNATGSLHYDGSDRLVSNDSYSETLYSNGIASYYGKSNAIYGRNVPTFDGHFEITPKKDLILLVIPNFKYTGNRNLTQSNNINIGTSGIAKSATRNFSRYNQDTFNSSLKFSITRRFNEFKKGRNLSFYLYYNINSNEEESPQIYGTHYYGKSDKMRKVNVLADTKNHTFQAQISYNEPLGRSFHFQVFSVFQYLGRRYQRDVYDIFAAKPDWTIYDDLPENILDYRLGNISSDGGYDSYVVKTTANIRLVKKKFNMTLGASVAPQFTRLNYLDESLEDCLVRKNAFYASPNVRIVYTPKKTQKLSFVYKSRTNMPSLYSLLPVGNGTNPLSVHYGNVDLLPAYTHVMELAYNKSNLRKQNSITVNVKGNVIQNQIVNMTSYDSSTGGTTSIPYNIEGNWNADMSMAYNKTLRYGFSLVQQASASYNNYRSFLYDSSLKTSEVNTMRRFMVKESFDVTYRNRLLELVANLNGDFTMENSALRPEMTQYPYSFGAGLRADACCPWDMRFVLDFSFLGQRGYIFESLNRNYYVLNASLSQSFLKKKLILSFEAYDILGQLPNLTRSFNASSRRISTYNGYNQYFMVKLVYKFSL